MSEGRRLAYHVPALDQDINYFIDCPPPQYDEECLVWANYQCPTTTFHHYAHEELEDSMKLTMEE